MTTRVEQEMRSLTEYGHSQVNAHTHGINFPGRYQRIDKTRAVWTVAKVFANGDVLLAIERKRGKKTHEISKFNLARFYRLVRGE